jgi:hypothetical protein
VVYKKRVSKTTFLLVLNSRHGNNMDEKKDALLPTVIWEPVDIQYILQACNVLAKMDLIAGNLS